MDQQLISPILTQFDAPQNSLSNGVNRMSLSRLNQKL